MCSNMCYLWKYLLPFLFILSCFTYSANCVRFTLNAADARGNHSINHRSNSTSGRVVRLLASGSLSLNFCLRENTSVTVSQVRYSNDGIPDECFVYLDGFLIATFVTRNWTGWGEMWNVFEHYNVQRGLVLQRGWHVLKLEIESGDGVEIDGIEMEFSDRRLSHDMVTCQLLCQANAPVVTSVFNRQLLPQYGLISQTSYPTACAEEDNIKIPIILQGILEYSLRATLPTYRSFENRREENTTGCSFLPHVYWTFKDITLPSKVKTFKSDAASLSVYSNSVSYLLSKTMSVTFDLFGRLLGHIDADIGSIFTIIIAPLNHVIEAKVTCYGRTGHPVILKSKYFLPGERLKKFDIADFTWSENKTNILKVTFNSYSVSTVNVEEVRLERRVMKPEVTETIFKSDSIVIDAVYMDFWWRAPESMTVNLVPNMETYRGIAYFRISRPIPWTANSYAQIFVLYQDGNARLLQLPPPGLDWIPFGSSVIIGATNPTSHRPSAPIKEVDIDPYNFMFVVRYADGSTADLKLISNIDETEVVVSNLKFSRDMSIHPFATLRSMYVEEGNSDCDSVMIDGVSSHHIMDQWRPMNGRSFMFYRRCESKHLTLSPDILVTIRRAHSGSVSNWWQTYVNLRTIASPSSHQVRRLSSTTGH